MCDRSAGITLVPRGQNLDAITAQLSFSLVKTTLFPRSSKLCYIFEDGSDEGTVPPGNCIETIITM